MDQVNFVEDSLQKFEEVWSAFSRSYPFKFFKGCLPQILLGPFLNTLSHIYILNTILLSQNWPFHLASEAAIGGVLQQKVFLKISQISHENSSNFIKKSLQHRCFPVKFAKFLKTSILKNTCERLLV